MKTFNEFLESKGEEAAELLTEKKKKNWIQAQSILNIKVGVRHSVIPNAQAVAGL